MGLAAVGTGGEAPAPGAALLIREEFHVQELWVRWHAPTSTFEILWKRLDVLALTFVEGSDTGSATNPGAVTVNSGQYQAVSLVNTIRGKRWGFFEFTGPGNVKSGVIALQPSTRSAVVGVLDGFETEETIRPGGFPQLQITFGQPPTETPGMLRLPGIKAPARGRFRTFLRKVLSP